MTDAASMDGSCSAVLSPPISYAVALAAADATPPYAVSTGFAGLDAALGGGVPLGTVSYLLSRPQAGRSMLALQFARIAAIRGDGVWFSGHDDEAVIVTRLRSAQSRVPQWSVRRPDPQDLERLELADVELGGSDLVLGRCWNESDLRGILEQDPARFQLVVLDGLWQQPSPNAWRPTAAELRAVAEQTATALLVTLSAPASHPTEARGPDPTEATGPADLIETADLIYALHRPNELGRGSSPDEDTAELALRLNRLGPTGVFPLRFQGWNARFVAS